MTTSKPRYEILGTGSAGNAVLLEGQVLADCGLPFSQLGGHYRALRLVLLTHIHADHFNRRTIRRLAQMRPTLRFGCCSWLVRDLADCGVTLGNIDVYECGERYDYGGFSVSPVRLRHDVPNCGYRLKFSTGRVFYATDTADLDGIEAPVYDLYLVEANYDEREIAERIADKTLDGEYAYERRVLKTHLSRQQCDDFIYRNIGQGGEYVYLHGHIDRPRKDDNHAN